MTSGWPTRQMAGQEGKPAAAASALSHHGDIGFGAAGPKKIKQERSRTQVCAEQLELLVSV